MKQTDFWAGQDSASHYRKQSGTIKFIYGRVIATNGAERIGWMAIDALEVSSGCPLRTSANWVHRLA